MSGGTIGGMTMVRRQWNDVFGRAIYPRRMAMADRPRHPVSRDGDR
jgi:hypothetical protein